MGHASIRTTEIYAHHIPKHHAADALSRLVKQASVPVRLLAAMDTRQLFAPVVFLNNDGTARAHAGTAFAVTPNGGFLTCRHVVDQVDQDGAVRPTGVIDMAMPGAPVIPVQNPVFPSDVGIDLAFLPNAVRRDKPEYLPLMPADTILMGEEVMTFGYYSMSGLLPVDFGLFSGRVVSVKNAKDGPARLTLPFPVIEGMSGSPIYTYNNGTKVVGVCFGSESQRIAASEVVDVTEGEEHYRETVNRVVEFGLAHHPRVVIDFLSEATTGFVISSGSVLDTPWLD
jgi:hypothetical protein